MKKIGNLLLLIAVMLMMTGCSKKQIFVTKVDPYALVPVEDNELEKDTYYVKDGSKFYKTYMPGGTVKNKSGNMVTKGRLLWVTEDETLIPTLYENEILALASAKVDSLEEIAIERFYDAGYGLGIYGGTFNSEGYYCFNISNQLVKDSNAYSAFKKSDSKEIRVATINGHPASEYEIDKFGIIRGDKDEVIELGFYSGTYYGTVKVTADMHMFESYEFYSSYDIKTTKNGYMSIVMPDNIKSGYYLVEGSGFFRYLSCEKGEHLDEDLNEAYYNENQFNEVYSQQYSVTVGAEAHDVRFTVQYNIGTYNIEDITCTLVSPESMTYNMEITESEAYVELATVMPGKWTIYVYPKDVEVKNVTAESTILAQESTKEVFEYVLEEGMANLEFYVDYEGDGSIWGTVSNENGETQELSQKDKKVAELSTTFEYLTAGTYTITVYHYTDVSISDTGYRFNEDNYIEEIITIQ